MRSCFRTIYVFIIGLIVVVAADAQSQGSPVPFPRPENTTVREPRPRSMRDVIEQRRIARLRRDHEDMLKRGEDAVRLAEELDESTAEKERLSAADRKKLEDLEKLVTRIRRDLGGGNDGLSLDEDDEIDTSGSLRDAISALRRTTGKLLDELKETSRFSISAVAIQTSNTALRIARFLRLR